MSETTSAATGRCFGIQRVCQVWERSRSALYARRARAHHHRLGAGPARRGPPPRQSDAQLLAAIRTDLARSPFHGEGHRKVHARLRILDGIRVARTRVLRVMRAHGLLSPHRGRQGAAKTHDGRVITQAPNVMWGTDGVRVFALDDGWGWIFAAVEHWNAECMGWHVCKVGSRFAALDPIAQGLERLYGSLDADVARGLALRMDHGSQYLSDHFLKQIRYWGIHPSFGFVEEPETNGVAERWNRTLKEQAIHGRIFQNLAAVRAAVADFVERYNQTWRLEKLGYHTPIEAREEYELRQAASHKCVSREPGAVQPTGKVYKGGGGVPWAKRCALTRTVSPSSKLLLMILSSFVNGDDEAAWPAQSPTLEAMTGLTSRGIRNATKQLEAADLMRVDRKGGKSIRYWLRASPDWTIQNREPEVSSPEVPNVRYQEKYKRAAYPRFWICPVRMPLWEHLAEVIRAGVLRVRQVGTAWRSAPA